MREQKGACLLAHLLQVDHAVGMSRGREAPYRGRKERESSWLSCLCRGIRIPLLGSYNIPLSFPPLQV